jgi:hypothetical protein
MKRVRDLVSPGLELELQTTRLDLLALFRALDRLGLAPKEIPQGTLHELFELDADLAEALHVLDLSPRGLDVNALVQDTKASLLRVPVTRKRLLSELAPRATAPLGGWIATIRPQLTPHDLRQSASEA